VQLHHILRAVVAGVGPRLGVLKHNHKDLHHLLIAGCKALGLIDKLVTGPLWRGKCKTWTVDLWTGRWTGLWTGRWTGLWTGLAVLYPQTLATFNFDTREKVYTV
jgi:hypothetical protein